MKNIIQFLPLFLIAVITSAHAADYQCFAPANPERGFSIAMQIVVDQAVPGGKITVKANGVEKPFATVKEVSTVHRANPHETDAFDAVVRLVHEEDVSGLKSSQFGRLTHIEAIGATLTDGNELYLYRLFADKAQIGGTVLAAGYGTACK